MGILKKLSKALSGKSSSKGKSSRQSESGLSDWDQPSSSAQRQNPYGKPSPQILRQKESKSSQRRNGNVERNPAPSVHLEHARRNGQPNDSAQNDNRERYINGNQFLTLDSTPNLEPPGNDQRYLDAQSLPRVGSANIREVRNQIGSQSLESSDSERVFQRPQYGKVQNDPGWSLSSQTNPALATNSQAQNIPPVNSNPAVALTIIIDSSLAKPKNGAQNVLADIGIGVLSLLRALSPQDTVSIFGYDEESSGLFTFQADKAFYSQILDLICKLHSKPLRNPPKLFEAIVLVVEELDTRDLGALKPLVIISDYQEKELLGPAFEAQHALLWSSAKNLCPIFVSVWDSELFSEVRLKSSKEVHIETLNSQEISAAFMVMLSHLKVMTKHFKAELELKKLDEMHLFENEGSQGTNSTRENTYENTLENSEQEPGNSPSENQSSTVLEGLPSPEIEDRKTIQSPEESVHHSPKPSIQSDTEPRDSEFDSTANFPTSSEGNADRDAVSLTDFAHEIPGQRILRYEDPIPISGSDDLGQDFKGFTGHGSNPLFLDDTDDEEFQESMPTQHNLTEVPFEQVNVRF